MSAPDKAMKPATHNVPTLVKVSFIGLEVVVLALHATHIYLDPDYPEHRSLGMADFWLAFTLLASTVVLYFRAPRLADSGVVAIILWVLMCYLCPTQL